jgi:hypothetical protein
MAFAGEWWPDCNFRCVAARVQPASPGKGRFKCWERQARLVRSRGMEEDRCRNKWE